MYKANTKIHFVGISGVGMAGIAELLLSMGYQVSGSDLQKNSAIVRLEKEFNLKFYLGHDSNNIKDDLGVVVFSSAIPKENPELVTSRAKNILTIRRAEMLSELMRMKYGVAVLGSHGKTTTTSLIAHILNSAGLDPTVAIGGKVQNYNSGANLGGGKFFVAEADESDGSFKRLRPAISILTNLDKEHLETYGSFRKMLEEFEEFFSAMPFYGLVVLSADNKSCEEIAGNLRKLKKPRVKTYSIEEENFKDSSLLAKDIEQDGLNTSFKLEILDKDFLTNTKQSYKLSLPMPGKHMVSNALAAITVALELSVSPEQIKESLKTYKGVSRRTEVLKDEKGVLMIDDYAHHPTEIKATVSALRSAYGKRLKKGRLITAFQPHRFSRTKELYEEFSNCLGEASQAYILDIYAAGEKNNLGLSSKELAGSIKNTSAAYVSSFDELKSILRSELKDGDILLSMGAGSIGAFAREFADEF